MKRALFILLLTSCASVMASRRGNLFLEITVQNNTPTICYLTRMKLIHGEIPSTILADVEYKILSGETMTLPRVSEEFYNGPKVDLFYECEGGRAIVFESEKTLFRTTNQVTEHLISAVSMDATFTSTPANWYQGEPGKIRWVLV